MGIPKSLPAKTLAFEILTFKRYLDISIDFKITYPIRWVKKQSCEILDSQNFKFDSFICHGYRLFIRGEKHWDLGARIFQAFVTTVSGSRFYQCTFFITDQILPLISFIKNITDKLIKYDPNRNSNIEWTLTRVSVQGVKSLGGHFACLCRGFYFYEVKKILSFFKNHFYSETSSKRAK